MNRPLIGITTYRQPATWGRWHEVDATLLPAAYTEAVRAGGGTPILIPPLGPADSAAAVVSRLDGLLISGGSDVNPSRYGAEPHPATTGWRDDRDVSEMALVHAADDIGLPLLGICRGMQIMAVAAGGELDPARPGRGRQRRPFAGTRCVRRGRGDHRTRNPARTDPRRAGRRGLPPPPGRRRSSGIRRRGHAPTTACWRPWRHPATASGLRCNGIRKPNPTAGCSRRSPARPASGLPGGR